MKADKEFLRNAVAEIIDTEPEKIGDDTKGTEFYDKCPERQEYG